MREILFRAKDEDSKNWVYGNLLQYKDGSCSIREIDLSSYKGEQRKDKIARNLVDYEAGLTIFNTARNIIAQSNIKQQSLFDDIF